jgi:hypothetical protein
MHAHPILPVNCEGPCNMKPPLRIAVLHFSHETVTFLANDTTLADFIYPGSRRCWRVIRGATWAAS